MIGLRLPKKGGPVGKIFPPASFGNLLLMDPTVIGPYFLSVGSIIALLPFLAPVFSALAVLEEIEFDGGRGEPLFESADLGLADTAEFLQGQSAGVAVGGKIG